MKLKPIKKKKSFWDKWTVKKHKDKSLEESFKHDMDKQLASVVDLDYLAEYLEYRIVMHVKRMAFMNEDASEHQRGRLFEVTKILEHVNKLRKKD
jgi:hypothetical protein